MRLSLSLIRLLCAGLLMTAPVLATENDSTNEHIPVGSRMVSRAEHAAVKEQRALQEKLQIDESTEPRDLMDSLTSVDLCVDSTKKTASEEEEAISKRIYFTSHPGCYYSPIAIDMTGKTVQINDGSVWTVRIADRYKTLTWYSTDIIVITPNHTWFSDYDYRLHNQNTGESVAANLTLGPFYNGIYTHWIVALDYKKGLLWLEDGSFWDISYWDKSTLRKFILNDTIILGINDGWWSVSRPNILINVSTLSHVRGNCEN